ncbi:indole-3-glycerol phosphate synthase TrpC [Nitrospirales bacterium NOB]|nr:Indole-3-glycerol phosphate synthase [Nitrospirota bacterium]MCE7965754.1 indole-3-glycerol phosphate synthase TrpC [Nitrospira sp. NTP2]MCK6493147.1 indole-3-glycerol phosphate synthase TrpC [Nitrospira sp.]MDL1890117.1 indole-3-glycerol phosphate synthase TrpC [Nitrospirales bacterium NOB]MEB2339857.1 indole-3-glycerol phosphate synthase TrpC [Nitrospirales bacterium]
MILDRILEHKKAEIRHKSSRGYLAELKNRIRDAGPTLGFAVTLDAMRRPERPALIAEVKKASPSLGLLRPEFEQRFEPVAIAGAYREHGASALSVLTDKDFFQGSLDYLAAVKQQVGLPALNKEFMVADIQFYEARAYGADAVLLIVAGLEKQQLIDFFALAKELSLDVLVETHHEREVDIVLEWLPDVRLIGINNRDLKTFSTDLGVTARLVKRIPADKLVVSESGIHKRGDVERLVEAGVHAMLIGESLIRAQDIGAKIRELLGDKPKKESR